MWDIFLARKLIKLGKINVDSMNTQVVKTANQPPKPTTIMSASSSSASYANKSSAPKEILVGETFNPAKDLKYSKPKANTSGGKSVGILNASTNGATYISTPLMLTWGVSTFEDKKTGEKTYSMSLQFPGEEYNTPAITKFRANLVKFEEKVKADALANQKDWFGKTTLTQQHIDFQWTPMLKFAKGENGEPDHNKNPTLSVKMPIWEGVWNVELFDPSTRKIFPDPCNEHVTPLDLIAKGSHVAVVLQCGGVWFAGGKFGVTWKLFQAVVKPKTTLRGKCHISLSQDDKKMVETQEIDTISDDDIPRASNEVQDSDGEQEEEEESPAAPTRVASCAAPAPAPTPVPAAALEPAADGDSGASAGTKKIVKKVVKK
jgi:hypothetical protein